MNELKKGGDFSELARKYSDDRLTAQKGGVMGYVDVESLPKGIKDAVSEMKEGEVKGPIMTEFGYHIIKAGSPVTDEILPYEAVRNTAIAYLRAKVIAEMRDRLRKKAKIKLIKR
jgi:parvulin-like peptidyl-prolyl isomerase